MNKKKTILISTGVLGTLSLGALGVIGNYFYNLALNPKTSKESIFGSKEEENSTSGELIDEDLNWFLNNSNYSNINIKSFDNLNLNGYKILNPTSNNNWVITVHGYTSKGIDMCSYARKFYDMGYNILMPDLRSHGKSEGTSIGMGWIDRLDVLKWINFILKDNKDANIILHGVSMGAATVSMVSGEDLPSNVKVIIADCGYTSVLEQFSHKLKEMYSLNDFPIMNACSFISKFRAGYSLKEASSLKQVSKSKTPILFIHGDKDDFVPYKMMAKLYTAANCPKEQLTIKNAGHAEASKTNPDLYWTTIGNFIHKHLMKFEQ